MLEYGGEERYSKTKPPNGGEDPKHYGVMDVGVNASDKVREARNPY
jgi:hypothetical protein